MENLEKESVEKICEHFHGRMIAQKVKFESKDFYKCQTEFVCGVVSALSLYDIVPPAKLAIAVLSRRPICEPY